MRKLQAVSKTLPEPPYPSTTQAHRFKFQIDHERLNQSDTWELAPQDMRPWLLMLWLKGWQQIPAGSFPADDDLVALKIGMDRRVFAGNRDILMRGWVLHNDGRLYHPVIVEQVNKVLTTRNGNSRRKQKQRLSENCHAVSRVSHGMSRVTLANANEPDEVKPEPKKKNPPKILSPIEDIQGILDLLNKRTGANFQLRNKKNEYTAAAYDLDNRIREHSLEQIAAMVEAKVEEWQGSEKMRKYLTPSTLFGKKKCDNYIGNLPAAREQKRNYGSFLDEDIVADYHVVSG